MTTTQVTTRDNGTQAIDDQELERLGQSLDGSVVLPGSDEYEDATSIWNGMITKRPAVVIRSHSTEDVVKAVAFARDNGFEMSIKGGGHNIAGLALSDGGVTLDLSPMRDVEVDVPSMRVSAGPGCTLGDVDVATQEYGLATTLGFVSETGIAGLTLGGGFGYLTRQFGWTVDDLLEVEIVTASGDIARASRNENKELFWALRGGGGNFGVVTEFVYGLHQIGPEITAGLIAWSADRASEVLRTFREVTDSAPRQLTLAVLMRNAPPAPWLTEDRHGEPMIAFVVNHTGTPEDAERDLAPIRAIGDPWADLIQLKEYTAQQSMLDATQPKGMHYYWKSEFLPGLDDDLLDVYRAQFEEMDSPANQIVLFHLEGALAEHAEDDGAIGNRDAAFACVIQSMYPDSSRAEDNRRWVRSAWKALEPYSTGGNYVNFQTSDEDDQRIAGTYRENLERLRRVKADYDPENLFRVNRNIQPA